MCAAIGSFSYAFKVLAQRFSPEAPFDVSLKDSIKDSGLAVLTPFLSSSPHSPRTFFFIFSPLLFSSRLSTRSFTLRSGLLLFLPRFGPRATSYEPRAAPASMDPVRGTPASPELLDRKSFKCLFTLAALVPSVL